MITTLRDLRHVSFHRHDRIAVMIGLRPWRWISLSSWWKYLVRYDQVMSLVTNFYKILYCFLYRETTGVILMYLCGKCCRTSVTFAFFSQARAKREMSAKECAFQALIMRDPHFFLNSRFPPLAWKTHNKSKPVLLAKAGGFVSQIPCQSFVATYLHSC